MPLTEEQRERICAAARSYLGTKAHPQGRDRLGMDCVGIGECAYIDAGMPMERTPAVYRGLHSKLLMSVLRRYFRKLPGAAEAKPADLVIYGIIGEGHLGILVPGRRPGKPMNGIHCSVSHGVVEARFDVNRGDIRGFYTWA